MCFSALLEIYSPKYSCKKYFTMINLLTFHTCDHCKSIQNQEMFNLYIHPIFSRAVVNSIAL